MTLRLSIAFSAVLALAQFAFVMPASADSGATAAAPAATRAVEQVAPLEACPTPANGARLAQVASTECCKDQKGICGCRAGKIVCCDSKPSTHPGCTCHGDNGFIE